MNINHQAISPISAVGVNGLFYSDSGRLIRMARHSKAHMADIIAKFPVHHLLLAGTETATSE